MMRFAKIRSIEPLAQSARVTLLIAVVMVQLQVPVPMAHDHDAVDSQGALIAHIDRHHHETLDEDGFHWHWVLPRAADATGESTDPSLPTPCHGSLVVSSLGPPLGTPMSVGAYAGVPVFAIEASLVGQSTSQIRIASCLTRRESRAPSCFELGVIRC